METQICQKVKVIHPSPSIEHPKIIATVDTETNQTNLSNKTNKKLPGQVASGHDKGTELENADLFQSVLDNSMDPTRACSITPSPEASPVKNNSDSDSSPRSDNFLIAESSSRNDIDRSVSVESDGDYYSCGESDDDYSDNEESSEFSTSKEECHSASEMTDLPYSPSPRCQEDKQSEFSDQICGTADKENNEGKDLFSRMEEENGTKIRYNCKICQHESPTIGGIKNHITRSHKITTVKKEKGVGRKCKKQIHNPESAGIAVPYVMETNITNVPGLENKRKLNTKQEL